MILLGNICADSKKHFRLSLLLLQVGLKGEAMNLVSPDSISSVDWLQASLVAQKQQPLTWHKVRDKGLWNLML